MRKTEELERHFCKSEAFVMQMDSLHDKLISVTSDPDRRGAEQQRRAHKNALEGVKRFYQKFEKKERETTERIFREPQVLDEHEGFRQRNRM